MEPVDSAVEPSGRRGARHADLLPAKLVAKLDRLRLTVRHTLSTRPGQTLMPHGSQRSGIELESYRTYTPGDDLRHLDWNAYGRLDQLLIKAFRAEREAPLHLFVDCSASMAFPESDGKVHRAAALAASLAYVSVSNHDPVRVVSLSAALPRAHVASPFCRHRQMMSRLLDFLGEMKPAGETALARGISQAARSHPSAGVAIVLSDFLMPPREYEDGLGELLARGYTVSAIRLLGAGEREPQSLFRRGRIVDAESGAERFVTLSPANLERYHRALGSHLETLRSFCLRAGVAFVIADTAEDLEESLFKQLPAAGTVRT